MATSPFAWQLTWMPARCTRSIQALRFVLRLRDVALVRRHDAGIGRAERHGAFGERSVDGVLGGGAEPNPLVAETGHDAAGDHRVQHLAAGFVAHPMQEFAARPHLLQSRQIAALVVDAGHAITHELFGNVCQPVAVALQPLLFGKGRPLADAVERAPGPVGDPAVEVAIGVAVEGPAGRIGRVLVDVRHLEGLAVVVRRVAAAMMDRDRVILRYLVEVVNVQLAIVLDLGVVEEIPFHPMYRASVSRALARSLSTMLEMVTNSTT